MNRFAWIAALLSISLTSSLSAPAAALAGSGTRAPNNVSCKEYVRMAKPTQLSLAAWLDGYSSSDQPVSEVRYSPGDVTDMQEKLLLSCEKDAELTLGDTEFDYRSPEPPFVPTCAAYNTLKGDENTYMVGWALGYAGYNSDVESINLDALPQLAADLSKQCQAAPDANMLELTIKNQKIED